jgi:hypothetical protein
VSLLQQPHVFLNDREVRQRTRQLLRGVEDPQSFHGPLVMASGRSELADLAKDVAEVVEHGRVKKRVVHDAVLEKAYELAEGLARCAIAARVHLGEPANVQERDPMKRICTAERLRQNLQNLFGSSAAAQYSHPIQKLIDFRVVHDASLKEL